MIQTLFYLLGAAAFVAAAAAFVSTRNLVVTLDAIIYGVLFTTIGVLMGRVARLERLLKPHLDKMEAREEEKQLRRPRPDHPTEVEPRRPVSSSDR